MKTKITIILFLFFSSGFFSTFNLTNLYGQVNITSDLEAVLIVGHQEENTSEAIKQMDKIAGLLKEYGITIHTFYDKKAEWEEIKKVAPQCSFLIYSGHGSNLGENGTTGGLCIKSSISTKTLLSELSLKQNAIVIFKSVCGGAGSSAEDDKDIGINEAKKRVSDYAYPFLKIGSSAYYANNSGNGCYDFLKDILSGTALKKAYENSTKFWYTIEFEEPFKRDKTKQFSIASSAGGGMATLTTYTNGIKTVTQVPNPKGYKVAYVGEPDFDIKKLAGK